MHTQMLQPLVISIVHHASLTSFWQFHPGENVYQDQHMDHLFHKSNAKSFGFTYANICDF